MAIANVTLSDTFDQWRIKTNQTIYAVNELDSNSNLYSVVSNTSSLYVTPKFGRGNTIYIAVNLDTSLDNTSTNVIASANSINVLHELYLGGVINTVAAFDRANGVEALGGAAFDKANSANVFVYTVAASSNAYTRTFANTVAASANVYSGAVGDAGNANLSVATVAANGFATLVGAASNANLSIATIASNTYATSVGTAGNANLSIATIAANNFAGSMANSSNNYAGSMSNTAYEHANNAYLRANQANSLATAALAATGEGGSLQSYAIQIGDSANNYAGTMANSSNAYTRTFANTVGTSANAYTDSAGLNANAYTRVFANSVGTAANANLSVATVAANAFATATFFAKTGGTISGDVSVTGNLTITGATTYTNTNTLLVGDNIFTLNADIPSSATPTENAGMEINRGNKNSNAAIIWNETSSLWMFTSNTLNNYTTAIASNTSVDSAGAVSNAYTDVVVTANLAISNAYTRVFANSVGTAGNTYTDTVTTANLVLAQTYANTKLANTSGTVFNGSLGLNAAPGSSRLYVNGSMTIGNTAGGIVFVRNLSGLNRIDSYNNDYNSTYPLYINSSNLRISTADTDRITIDGQGNVGIGVTSTTYKLDVNGTANISTPTLFVAGKNVLSYIDTTNTYIQTSVVTARLANTSGTVFGGNLLVAGSLSVTQGGLVETRTTMAANNVDLSTGSYFTKTISGATTLTVSNVPASGSAGSFILDLTNGGSATITWWTGVKWAGGTAPSLTASGRDSLGFYTYDGGTTWTGLVLGKDIK